MSLTELAISGPLLVAIALAVAAGTLSFVSPCAPPSCRATSPTWPDSSDQRAVVARGRTGPAVAVRASRWRVAGAAMRFGAGPTTLRGLVLSAGLLRRAGDPVRARRTGDELVGAHHRLEAPPHPRTAGHWRRDVCCCSAGCWSPACGGVHRVDARPERRLHPAGVTLGQPSRFERCHTRRASCVWRIGVPTPSLRVSSPDDVALAELREIRVSPALDEQIQFGRSAE
jgi:hypothetical protein